MSDKMPTIDQFMDNEKDYGLEPISEPIPDAERKLASLLMATNATVMQLINEGVLDPPQMLHFMIHLQEFANRIYKGETVKLPGVPQTLAVDSIGGKLFVQSANIALTEGVQNAINIREALKEAQEQYHKRVGRLTDDDDKQTSLEQNNEKPTVH